MFQDDNTKKVDRIKYYVVYIIISFVLLFCIFLPFLINNKTLLGEGDALYQHVPFMDRIKDFLIYNIKALLSGKELQQIDFNTFMGLDIIQTYNYYGYGNPLYLVTVFFKTEHMTYAHAIIFFSSIWLGGIAFSEYCFFKEKLPKYVLLGTILYIVSPLAVLSFVPLCFSGLCYQIPLLFLGFDKILNKSKGKTFTFAIFLMALSGFYYLYMSTIFLFLYGVIKVFRKNNYNIKESLTDGVIKIFRTALLYLIGLGLAAPLFIPNMYGFFNCARRNHQLHHIRFFERNWLGNLNSLLLYIPENYVTFNIGVIIILIKLYTIKKHKLIKILTPLFIISTQFSLIGLVFNGFSVSSDRWFLFFHFYIAYVAVIVLTELKLENLKSFSVILAISCLVQPLIMSCMYSGYELCIKQSFVNELFNDDTSNNIDKDEQVSRVEYLDYYQNDNRKKYSYSYAKQFTSPWLYSSTVPENMYNCMTSFGNSNFIDLNTIYGLNERPELHSLFNIKYLYNYKNQITSLPDFYEKINDTLYKNTCAVPFGYCYDQLVNDDTLTDMNPIQKSYLALDYGIVDDSYSESTVQGTDTTTPNNVQSIDDFEFIPNEDNKYTINFNSIKNSQLYIELTDSEKVGLSLQFYPDKDNFKYARIVSMQKGYCIPKNNIVANIGYFDTLDSIQIKANNAIKKDDIKLYSVDLSNYKSTITNLSQYHLDNIEFTTNKIEGTIDIPTKKSMCLSIPNLDGWDAYIDDKKVNTYSINYMFIGIDIPQGKHTITLKYHTPLLKTSVIIFCISILLLISLYILENKRKK
ncbi:YfhO family protein [Eubacterium sp.]|uniref:YfhO family protein n=1 Tax=Eubacterium sp. TaxID=142586 RepID=UPI0025E7A5BA|nr:YfhO family protein [Eubacterium sp.]MCR5628079.1 YfhO family protein [Eubacterium sp.]